MNNLNLILAIIGTVAGVIGAVNSSLIAFCIYNIYKIDKKRAAKELTIEQEERAKREETAKLKALSLVKHNNQIIDTTKD